VELTEHSRQALPYKPDVTSTNEIRIVSAASDPRRVDEAIGHPKKGARDINLSFSLGYAAT